MMPKVGTPTVAGFVPGLVTTTDVVLNAQTKLDFMDSLFSRPELVDFDVKTSWIGQACLQPAVVSGLMFSRNQDPEKLYQAGEKGLPALLLSGTADKQVLGDVVAAELSMHFKDIDVVSVEGGSHALFYEYQDDVVGALLKFVEHVAVRTPFTHG